MRSYAELHVHVEGALEPELAIALAEKNNVELPFATADDLRAKYQYTTVEDYLDLSATVSSVLRTPDDFTELTNAYLTRAKAAGVSRAEISCDLASHLARGLSAADVLSGISAALAEAEANFGISTGLILGFPQDLTAEAADETYAAAMATGTDVVAVGICLNRAGASTSAFTGLFGRARSDGLHTVAHVGSDAGVDVVWKCLHDLKVGRIGSCAVDDRDLMYYLADYSIPLTLCPLANEAVHGAEHLQHPLPTLLDEGVVVTINSEAPAYFGGYLDANLAWVNERYEMSDAQLGLLARNSFTAAFISESKKAELSGMVPA